MAADKPRSQWSFASLDKEQVKDEDLAFLAEYTDTSDYNELRTRIDHLRRTAEESLHVYKCITRNGFLSPRLPSIPAFSEVSKTAQVLEIGACFGTEVRGLLSHGFQADNIVAVDVVDGYWKLGQSLYGDAPEGIKTLWTDMALPKEQLVEEVKGLFGTRDLVIAMAVFHVLNQGQVDNIVHNIGTLCKAGSQFIGTCVGAKEAGPWSLKDGEVGNGDRYLHSPETLSSLFKDAGFSKVDVHQIRRDDDPRRVGNSSGLLLIQCTK